MNSPVCSHPFQRRGTNTPVASRATSITEATIYTNDTRLATVFTDEDALVDTSLDPVCARARFHPWTHGGGVQKQLGFVNGPRRTELENGARFRAKRFDCADRPLPDARPPSLRTRVQPPEGMSLWRACATPRKSYKGPLPFLSADF